MDIIQKLKLQHQLGGLVLFREGVFLQAYNESCYILTVLLNQKLQLRYKVTKKVGNKLIISCGFPQSQLAERLPKAELLPFGAKLLVEFDKAEYQYWYLQRQHHFANRVSKVTDPRKEAVCFRRAEN